MSKVLLALANAIERKETAVLATVVEISGASPIKPGAQMTLLTDGQTVGLVRASFGLYNTLAEVDTFVNALAHIARGEYMGQYHQDPASGDFMPENWTPDFADYFAL